MYIYKNNHSFISNQMVYHLNMNENKSLLCGILVVDVVAWGGSCGDMGCSGCGDMGCSGCGDMGGSGCGDMGRQWVW